MRCQSAKETEFNLPQSPAPTRALPKSTITLEGLRGLSSAINTLPYPTPASLEEPVTTHHSSVPAQHQDCGLDFGADVRKPHSAGPFLKTPNLYEQSSAPPVGLETGCPILSRPLFFVCSLLRWLLTAKSEEMQEKGRWEGTLGLRDKQ